MKALLKSPPPARPTIYFDEDTPGFGVRRFPSGQASFVLEYRPRDSGRDAPKKRMKIGSVGEITLERARAAAIDMKAAIRVAKPGEGADPVEERQIFRRAETLEELVQEYLDRHVKPKRKATTLALYEGYLRKHIAPRLDGPESPLRPGALGGKKAVTVTSGQVDKLHRSIGETRPRTANAVVTLISSAYTWGGKKRVGGLTPGHVNPAAGIERFAETKRKRALTADEWAALGETLTLAETVGLPRAESASKHAPKANIVIDRYAVACIRLLALTGCRLREILNLEWAHVDIENERLNLPDSKTGEKVVLLSAQAIAILRGLQSNYRFVIAGETAGQKDERPRADLHRPWSRIVAHAGLGARGVKGEKGYRPSLRIHDLRHAHAGNAVGLGNSLVLVGALLGHKDLRTTARYANPVDEVVSNAANANAASIATKMGRGTRQ